MNRKKNSRSKTQFFDFAIKPNLQFPNSHKNGIFVYKKIYMFPLHFSALHASKRQASSAFCDIGFSDSNKAFSPF